MINALTLEKSGIISAVLLGMLIFAFGGNLGFIFLVTILWFLVLAFGVTEYGKAKKQKLGLYERYRTWKNVLANGAVPLLAVVLYAIYHSPLFMLAYFGSVSAITADKFASEVGVLDGEPIMLLTLKRVKKGTSGAVTELGLAASIIGSLAAALPFFLLPMQAGIASKLVLLAAVTLAGFFGNLFDSVLGYFEEKGIGNKYTSNAGCALAGFILMLLFASALYAL